MRRAALVLPVALLALIAPAARAAEPTAATAGGRERVRALNELAKGVWSSEPQKALGYAQEALQLSVDLGDEPGRVDALRLLGRAEYQLDRNGDALRHFQESLERAKRLGDRERIADATNDVGIVHYVWGEYQEALDAYTRALDIRRQLGNDEKLAASYNNVGTINYVMRSDESALAYYGQAHAIYARLHEDALAASTLNNVGLVHARLHRLDDAQAAFDEALRIQERLHDTAGMAGSLNNLGMVLEGRKRLREALAHYERALALRRAMDDRKGIAIGLHNIGGIHAKMGRPREALDAWLLPALALTRELGLKELERDTLSLLSETYERVGDTARALEYYRRFKAVSDGLLDARTAEKLANLRTRFEIEQKDRQIGLLRERERVQATVRNAILGGAGLLVALVVLLWRGYRLKDRASRQMRRANDALRLAQQESERAARAELARVARVSLMGELATAIAHELKQPLTAIRANAQATRRLLAAGRHGTADFDEALGDIADEAGRANDIIQKLRRLVSSGDVAREPLAINDVLRDVERFASAAAREHRVALELDLAPDLPAVAGDRIQLQQVVLNLVHNAVEAMDGMPPPRRRVEIRTARDANGGVAVAVRDHGPGLPQDALPRMFEPFYTTKPGGGLGMGLAICSSIVKAHGGVLRAARNPDEGLTLAFSLQPAPSREVPA